WRHLAEKHLFRMRDSEPPMLTPGERNWLRVYMPLAFAYRITVLVAIVTYVAGAWFFIGVLLAIWGVGTMLGLPLAKAAGYLSALPRAQGARRRAQAVVGTIVAVLLVIVLAVPMPMRTQTQGVVWLPDEAQVRAG